MTINQTQQLLAHALKALEADDIGTATDFIIAAQTSLDELTGDVMTGAASLVQETTVEPLVPTFEFDSVFAAEVVRRLDETNSIVAAALTEIRAAQ